MNTAASRMPASGPRFRSSNELPGLSLAGIIRSMQSFASLSEVLRILGAGIVLAAMSLYLLQGWHDGNDVQRYLLLLAQTGLLAMAGFAMSHGLNEPRGARVFFGLALVSIPANFTILGALVYSVLQWDGALGSYPDYATWRIDDVAVTGVTVVGAVAVLLPIALFCFAIMARRSSWRLAGHFVLLNALLLLPVRSSLAAGAIALVGVAYAVWVVRYLLPQDSSLRTAEGRFALGTLYLPMGIVLFRSLYFYDVDSLMLSVVATAGFLALRQAAVFPDRNRLIAGLLDAASLPIAALAAGALADAFDPALDFGLLAPLAATVFAAFGIDIAARTASRAVGTVTRVAVCLAVFAGFGLSVAADPSAMTAVLAYGASIALLMAGRLAESRTATVTGVLTLGAAILFGTEPLIDLIAISEWYVLAAIGIASIAVGSVIERHGAALAHRARHLTRRREGKSP